ncbi:hypothetical protein HN51_064014 [Arachis hypogaea]|uniref:uncharacterized protein isoform X1 n=1 Tax=Arachis hypogaea TaxID=3818 RepID=UPI0007AF5C74|nr:uncharacterized protein LOC112723267 isoform X1 [Arachis hypogaea]XP_025630346.1 uncharacterized protein LOC112723267 isoform X1 [Arachis hypogaea]
MVGGGSKREEAPVINSPFVFAALGSLKKKKKPEILRRNRLHPRGEPPRPLPPPLPPPHNSRRKRRFFWPRRHSRRSHGLTLTTRMMTIDDYYAITAPPQSIWGAPVAAAAESEAHAEQESDSEIEGLDDAEDEHENELEAPVEPETVVKKPREPSLSTKETEEQLSKKELKKKELEELEAVLAELGLQKEPGSQADSHGAEKKVEDRNGELEKKENATSENKNAKKKKKDKSSKEQKESQDLPDSVVDGKTTMETAGTGKAEDAPVTDVKEWHKKVASVKKKKSRRWMLLLVRHEFQLHPIRINSTMAAVASPSSRNQTLSSSRSFSYPFASYIFAPRASPSSPRASPPPLATIGIFLPTLRHHDQHCHPRDSPRSNHQAPPDNAPRL